MALCVKQQWDLDLGCHSSRYHGERMEPGLAELLPPLPPQPRILRTLWRMQGPSRLIVAEIHRHPVGRELVVTFGGDDADVLETRFERLNFSALERRADELRAVLLEKGWVEVLASPSTEATR
jgi:hypothetical protein